VEKILLKIFHQFSCKLKNIAYICSAELKKYRDEKRVFYILKYNPHGQITIGRGFGTPHGSQWFFALWGFCYWRVKEWQKDSQFQRNFALRYSSGIRLRVNTVG
jgi:hypothetical protein